jgi:acetoin utilization deacetylase AcuC-like enzyme
VKEDEAPLGKKANAAKTEKKNVELAGIAEHLLQMPPPLPPRRRWRCEVCTEVQPLAAGEEEEADATCRDCGAPLLVRGGGAADAPLLPLTAAVLGLMLLGDCDDDGGESSGAGARAAAAGRAFLAAHGLGEEEALARAAEGAGAPRLSSASAPRRPPASAPPAPAAPRFGLAPPPLVGLAYDARMLGHWREEGGEGCEGGRGVGSGSGEAEEAVLERPDRLRAAVGALAGLGLAQACARLLVREATAAELALAAGGAAGADAVEACLARAARECAAPGAAFFEPRGDVYWSAGTGVAARLALGAVCEAVRCAALGVVDRALCLVRPPGHHAGACGGGPRGFCVLNNVGGAVAAALAADAALRRVLVVDLDVHHGDGTQALFERDARVLTFSLHRHDGGEYFPGSGHAEAVGEGAGAGFACNVAVDGAWHGDAELLATLDGVLAPLARAFAPQLVVVSLGLDSARGDALGDWDVTPAGYAHSVHALAALGAPLVVALEGGYNCAAVAASLAAVARVLLGEAPPPLAEGELRTAPLPERAVLEGGDGGEFYGSGGGGEGAERDRAHCEAVLRAGRAWRRGGGAAVEAHPGRRMGPRPAARAAIEAARAALRPHWPGVFGDAINLMKMT